MDIDIDMDIDMDMDMDMDIDNDSYKEAGNKVTASVSLYKAAAKNKDKYKLDMASELGAEA
jgi:hypothetical protein